MGRRGLLPGESISRYRGASDEAPASFPSGPAASVQVPETEHAQHEETAACPGRACLRSCRVKFEPYEAACMK